MANGINALARGRISAPTDLTPTPIDPGLAQNALLAGRRAQRQSRLDNLRISEAERQRDEAILDDLTASVLGATNEAEFNTARDDFARRRGIPVAQLQGITFAQLPALRNEAEGARNILAASRRREQPLTPAQERQFRIQEQRNAILAAQAGVPLPGAPGAPAAAGGTVQASTAAPAPATGGVQRLPGETAAAFSKRAAQRIGLQEGGRTVLDAVDDLSAEIGGRTISGATPEQKAQEQRQAEAFERATGPFVAGERTGISLQNALEGAVQAGREATALVSEETRGDLARLDRIRQSTQAINTLLQRALLRGQGQVTENERAQINRILGSIATARSAADAQASLDNFRTIVRRIFRLPAETAPRQQAPRTQEARQPAPARQPSGQAAAAPTAEPQTRPQTGQRFETADDAAANIAEGQVVRDTQSGQFFQKQNGRLVPVRNPAFGDFPVVDQPPAARGNRDIEDVARESGIRF